MDLRLFSAFYPAISAETFAEWPDHMRREFALIAAEAGHSDQTVCARTGITAAALRRARATTGVFALDFKDVNPLDEAEEQRLVMRREWARKRRGADA